MKIRMVNVIALIFVPSVLLMAWGLYRQDQRISQVEERARALQSERDQLAVEREALTRQIQVLQQKKQKTVDRLQDRVDSLLKIGEIARLNGESVMRTFEKVRSYADVEDSRRISSLAEIATNFVNDHSGYRSYARGLAQLVDQNDKDSLGSVTGFDLDKERARVDVTMAQHKRYLETLERWIQETVKARPARGRLESAERRVSYYLTRRDQLTPTQPMKVEW